MPRSSNSIAGVVFDMDGVLFDTEPLYFESEDTLLRRRGRSFSVELAQRMMGVPALQAMEILRAEHGLAEPAAQLVAECRQLLLEKMRSSLCPMAGVVDLLDRVKDRGWPMAVATSTGREMTEWMLGRTGLRGRFLAVMTSDDVQRGKPDPEIYRLACRTLDLVPKQTLVLEDSLNGVRAAKAAGCHCIAVAHPLTRSLDFSLADLVIDGLLDRRLLAYAGLDHIPRAPGPT